MSGTGSQAIATSTSAPASPAVGSRQETWRKVSFQPGRSCAIRALTAGMSPRPGDLVRSLDGLKRAAAEVERPARLGPLEITYLQLNPVTVDPGAARRYAELGVSRLVVYPLPLEDPDDVLRFLEQHAALPR